MPTKYEMEKKEDNSNSNFFFNLANHFYKNAHKSKKPENTLLSHKSYFYFFPTQQIKTKKPSYKSNYNLSSKKI